MLHNTCRSLQASITDAESLDANIEMEIAELANHEEEVPPKVLLHSDQSQSESSSESSHDDVALSPALSPPSYSDLTSPSHSESSSSCESASQRQSHVSCIPSFKIVGDNVDKYVKPRHETTDMQASSLHYFHSFAVKDRCDVSALNDNPSRPDLTSFSIDEVLPTAADYTSLMTNYTIIAARIIQKHIPFFKKNVKKVIRHIPHSHSREMSQKSEVVSVHTIYSVSLHFTFLYNRFP